MKSELLYFEVYAGYDNNLTHNTLSEGNGCTGGLSDIYPGIFRYWMQAFNDNNIQKISRYQKKVDGLMDIYAINDPFTPLSKKALQSRGIIQSDRCTPPFSSLATCKTESIQWILTCAGIEFNA